MSLMNFGREQLQDGTLNDMLKQVGINDIGTFVDQFRSKVNQEAGSQGHSNAGNSATRQQATGQQPDFMSMGSSLFKQFGGGGGKGQGGSSGSGDLIGGAMNAYKTFSGGSGGEGQGAKSGGSMDMINNAMKAYKAFSGGKGSGEASGGSLFDNIGSTFENAQQLSGLMKQLDKNGDGKITVEDIQLFLQGFGLGSVSPYLSKALFQAVDKNRNGVLDLTDVMALAAIVNKLNSRFGSGAAQSAQQVS